MLTVILLGGYLLIKKKKAKDNSIEENQTLDVETKKTNKKQLAYGILLLILISAIAAVSSLLNLTGAKSIDAAVLYPMTTGNKFVLRLSPYNKQQQMISFRYIVLFQNYGNCYIIFSV